MQFDASNDSQRARQCFQRGAPGWHRQLESLWSLGVNPIVAVNRIAVTLKALGNSSPGVCFETLG
jgi:hypothetical protein